MSRLAPAGVQQTGRPPLCPVARPHRKRTKGPGTCGPVVARGQPSPPCVPEAARGCGGRDLHRRSGGGGGGAGTLGNRMGDRVKLLRRDGYLRSGLPTFDWGGGGCRMPTARRKCEVAPGPPALWEADEGNNPRAAVAQTGDTLWRCARPPPTPRAHRCRAENVSALVAAQRLSKPDLRPVLRPVFPKDAPGTGGVRGHVALFSDKGRVHMRCNGMGGGVVGLPIWQKMSSHITFFRCGKFRRPANPKAPPAARALKCTPMLPPGSEGCAHCIATEKTDGSHH